MGCSPSKGKLFSKPDNSAEQNQPLDQDSHQNVTKPLEENGRTDVKDLSCQRTKDEEKPTKEQSKEDEKVPVGQEKDTKTEKRKKGKHKRRCANRHRKSSLIQPKFEFPPQMVRAHQAAYSYLNPNISKYETLLSLLDQAAQTQLSLQPMMSALVMRFEEINQALEEMAEEGELMLREHGEYMAFPSGMLRSAIMPAKSKSGQIYHIDPPPDLLQQLLQHSTEKMRLVGGSARALGDTTLQEATDYYASLSRVLDEKLQTKQAVERRLTLVLARVEVAAMSKSNPEDTALHSEDSGIGGENESLTGSERHRRHRGSAGSGSCGSGANLRSPLGTPPNNSSNLVEHNEDDEGEEDEDEDEEEEDEEEDGFKRKRSNSSPPDPCQAIMYMRAKYIQQMKPALKRPMTAMTPTKPEQLSSSRCANITSELQRSQRDLDQRIKEMASMKELAGPHYDIYRSGLRRNSLCGPGAAPKIFPRNGSGAAPILAPLPPRRQSVRRLINTFSQGVDGRPGQSLANVPHHIRGHRKVTSLNTDGNNGNNNNNSWPDSKDDMDVDNLPPPPPEVLMDDSFQSMAGMSGNGEGSVDDSVRLTVLNQKPTASQRLRAGIQNIELLPNRASVGRCQPLLTHGSEDEPHLGHTRKVLHLKNSVQPANNANAVDYNRVSPSPVQDGDPAPSLPVTAPPVSRVRIPPSGPAARHRYPSPPVVRPPSRPGSPKTEIFPSVSFKDARSVFCQLEPPTPGNSGVASSYGEPSRGRLLTRRVDSNVRRTQSEQPPGTSRKQHP